jgi:hypothetical protein
MQRLFVALTVAGMLAGCGASYGSYIVRDRVQRGGALASCAALEDRTGKPVLQVVHLNHSPRGRWVALTGAVDTANRNPWQTLYFLDTETDRLHALPVPDLILVENVAWSPDGGQAAARLGLDRCTLAVIRLGDPPELTAARKDSRPPDRLNIVWRNGTAELVSPLEDGGVAPVGRHRIRTWRKSPRNHGVTWDLEDETGKVLAYDVEANISPIGTWAALLVPRPGGLASSLHVLNGESGRLTEIDARPKDLNAVRWSPDCTGAAVLEGSRDTMLGLIRLGDPPTFSWVAEDPRAPQALSLDWGGGVPRLLPPLAELGSESAGRFRLRTRADPGNPNRHQTDLEDEKGAILAHNVEARMSPSGDWGLIQRKSLRWGTRTLEVLETKRGTLQPVEFPGWPELRTVKWNPRDRSAALLVSDHPTLLAVIRPEDPPVVTFAREDPRKQEDLRIEWDQDSPKISPPPELVATKTIGSYRIRTWAEAGRLKSLRTSTVEDVAGKVLRYDVSFAVSPDGRWALLWDDRQSCLLVVADQGPMREFPVKGHVAWRTVTWSPDSGQVAILTTQAAGGVLTVLQRGDPPQLSRPHVDHRLIDFLEVRWKDGEGFRVQPH